MADETNKGDNSKGDNSKGGKAAAATASGMVVVECANRKNQAISFPPGLAINVTEGRVRGRWEKVNMGTDTFSESMRSLNVLQSIPGGCIALDYGQRRGMVFDPLEDAPGAALVESVRKALGVTNERMREIDSVFRVTFRHGVRPFERRTLARMTDDDVASWHYWLKRIVREGNGRIILGSFPTTDPEGRVKVDYTNTHFGVPRFKHQYDEMAAASEA